MSVIPNSTQVPNLYLDLLMGLLTEEELKTLLYAVRRTMGFSYDVGPKRISLSQFQNGNGFVDSAGNPLELGTRLSRQKQSDAVLSLTHFRILVKVQSNDRRRNEGAEWAVQLDGEKIDWEGLWQRDKDKKSKGRRKTAKARQAALAVNQSDSQTKLGRSDTQTSNKSDSQTSHQSDIQTEASLTVRHTRNQERNQERNQVEKEEHVCVGWADYEGWTEGEKQVNGIPEHEAHRGDMGLEQTWGMLLAYCEGDKAQAAGIWQLQEYFVEVSGVKRPDIDFEWGREELERDWWPGVLKVWRQVGGDLAQGKLAVREAVREQQAWKASSVANPGSIVKKVGGVLAGMKNGYSPSVIPSQGEAGVLPKGANGLAGYMQRRQG